MATLVNKARTKAVQIHHKGAKEGVKVKLEGVGTALKDVPTQGIKQNGYIITPSGANVGENISINGGGLVIRARNDKTQTITATSTPDNQLQVQVGQGKSAVQLSIQVTPQGSRGEVELQCVRNSQDKGATTGYTVSVSSYKRKLDTHHHKPTISYLIARRMTELFKEMRKTAEMHPPPPFVKF